MEINNNISIPDTGSRSSSPEMIHMTHLSPTELYGRDDLIGLPRLQTRPVSSQSNAESTLNTPDPGYIEDPGPGYIEDFDSEVSNVAIATDFNNNRGVKQKLMKYSDNAVENPVPYSFTEYTFQSIPSTISSSLSAESFSFNDSPMSGEIIGNEDCNAQREQQVFPKVSCQSFFGNASRRLNFRSPIDLSTRNDLRSPVEFNNFIDINGQFTNHQKILSFVSNQSCLPLNLTRPLPIFPSSSAWCWDTQQADMNYNSWSMPVSFSQCNFVPVNRNQLNTTQTALAHPYLEPLKYPSENHVIHNELNQFPTHQFWNISPEILQTSNCANGPDLLNFSLTPSTNKSYENMHHALQGESPPFVANACSLTDSKNNDDNERDIVFATDAANNNLEGTFDENFVENAQETGSEGDINVVILDENSKLVKESEKNISSDQFEVEEEQGIDLNANFLTEKSEISRKNALEQVETQPDVNTTITNSCLETPDHLIGKSSTDHCSTYKEMKRRAKNTKVPLCAKRKKIMVPISDFGNKTVKQLLDSAQKGEESLSEKSSLESTEQFKQRFMKERKAKSPLSAFCAALDEPKKTKLQPILPAEPRIPIPALLGPNEVPLMYSGSMLVPYFSPAVTAKSSIVAVTDIVHGADITGALTIKNSQISNSSHLRRCSLTQSTFGGPIMSPSLAVPLYSNPVYPSHYTKCPASTIPARKLPRIFAGIGRTGVLITMETAMCLIEANQPVYPLSIVRQMRDQRAMLIQTPNQYKFVCEAIISCFQVGNVNSEKEAKNTDKNEILEPDDIAECFGCSSIQPKETWSSAVQGGRHQLRRSWKARHYSFSVLRIGSYKYTCDHQHLDKAARVKFLFSKRKLVYEYQMDGSDDHVDTKKNMAEINIPFSTIIGFYLDDREMKLEVDTPPKMYKGIRSLEKSQRGVAQTTIYDRSKTVDLTLGQLEQCPYHLLHFKMCTEKIRLEMEQFDARFGSMLQRSFVMVPSKSLQSTSVAIDSYLLHPDRLSYVCSPIDTTSRRFPITSLTGSPSQGFSVQGLSSHCDCTDGCSAASCSCCAVGKTCARGSCSCVVCRNPVNILQNFGLSADKVTTDPCLMDNIYQIANLGDYVKTPLKLECCRGSTLLFSCIPGEVACPNPVCETWYKFSWCSAQLCNESLSPRNHCRKCRRCSDHRNRHCETCNMCYFAGEQGSFKCAVCHSYDSED